MPVWVDADACPQDIKEILYRSSQKRKYRLILVANQPLRVPRSEWIETILVGAGANVADQTIVDQCLPGDLVITADIPLAAAAIERGAQALNPRGELYTSANIGERLVARNLMEQLRSEGMLTGGPAQFSEKNRIAFHNQFDRWLTKAGH